MESKYCSKSWFDKIFEFYAQFYSRVQIFKKKPLVSIIFQVNILDGFSMKISIFACGTNVLFKLLQYH